jgi:hypothetical protein
MGALRACSTNTPLSRGNNTPLSRGNNTPLSRGNNTPLSIKISRTERMPRRDTSFPHTPLRRKGPYAKKSQAKKTSKSLAAKLCRCIKRVRPTQAGTKKEKEKAAIGICITSVLHSRGKTLQRFHCRPSPYLRTLKRKTPIINTP